VPADLIDAHGAVSEQVAVAMADGVRERLRADIGVSVTGIAGPSGGTTEKPVGTVAIAVRTTTHRADAVRIFRFVGDRHMVRLQATQAALEMTRRAVQAT
jgi:nicotinamide-nucleotide amidase